MKALPFSPTTSVRTSYATPVLTKISSVTIAPDSVSKITSIGSWVPCGALLVAAPLITSTLVSSSTQQEPDRVDLVHHGVPDHELGIEMITDRWVAMSAMHDQRVAQPAVGDQLLQRDVLGVEAPHEADLDELLAERLFLLHDRVGRGDVGGQRLLTQHRDTPIQACIELFRVGGTRAGDEHRIHVWIVDGRNRIGLDAGPDLRLQPRPPCRRGSR